jgi:hypothetical protein
MEVEGFPEKLMMIYQTERSHVSEFKSDSESAGFSKALTETGI